MARRTRRRSPVAWLPNTGAVQVIEDDNFPASTIEGNLDVDGQGDPVISIHGLTADQSAESAEILDQPVQLSDYTQSGYRLKRIVGKLFAAREVIYNSEGDILGQPGLVFLAAGFMVLRADPTTGAPIGQTTLRDYDPAGRYNIRDPWIWRRTWMLGAQTPQEVPIVTNSNQLLRAYPQSTAGYGSVLDGPHIDAKTARKIGPEERTFFIITARVSTFIFGSDPNFPLRVHYTLDYRLLGMPIRMTNRGNASR